MIIHIKSEIIKLTFTQFIIYFRNNRHFPLQLLSQTYIPPISQVSHLTIVAQNS